MRNLGLASALLLVGCTALNPAYQDGGGGTSNEEGSASDASESSPPTSTSTGRPGTGSGSGSSSPRPTSSSGGVFTSSTLDTGDPRPLEPFRVSITFSPRVETLFDFVARVEIEEPYLIDVPRTRIDFEDPNTAERVRSEIIEFDSEAGRLDAWVLLGVWDDDAPTVIDLVVGPEQGASPSPWVGYNHVWHLDDEDALEDVAGMAEGEFRGYRESAGLIAGVVGGARAFDGEDNRAEVAVVASPSSVIAAYGWARIDELPAESATLFSRSDGQPSETLGAENGVDWALTIDASGQARVLARVTNGVIAGTPPQAIPEPLEGWHHYAFVSSVQDNSMRLYVDGISSSLILSPIFTGITVPSFSMGGWYGEDLPAPDERFHGALDEVTVLHREVPFGWPSSAFLNQQEPSQTYMLGRPVAD